MITREQLNQIETPFTVKSDHDGAIATVIGFLRNDPLGVGGGALPDMPVACFDGGGWSLLTDLIIHWSITAPPNSQPPSK